MAQGKTTSMRFSSQLASRLEQAAKRLHKGKNAIISEALVQYLDSVDRERLEKQLIRDCRVLAKDDNEADWDELSDMDDWKWEDE